MDTIKATIVQVEEEYFIKIGSDAPEIRIPLSEERPNSVKNAFNSLIIKIKAGEFRIELENLGEDLFSQVANEYVKQLNREIQEIRGEMVEFNLVGE